MTERARPLEPLLPFGKRRGKTVSRSPRAGSRRTSPGFAGAVDGNETLKRAIRALPGFRRACGGDSAGRNREPDQEPDCYSDVGVDPRLSRGEYRQALPGDTPSAGRWSDLPGARTRAASPPSCASCRQIPVRDRRSPPPARRCASFPPFPLSGRRPRRAGCPFPSIPEGRLPKLFP